MTKLLGYMANRPDRLLNVLRNEEKHIGHPSSQQRSGWGLGFYHGDEVLHKKQPTLDDNELSWADIAANVQSDCAVFHHRQPTVGNFHANNTHPFRMRSWMFAHLGTIRGLETDRETHLSALPDFIRRNVRGGTDSEILFHQILAALHGQNAMEHDDPADDRVFVALRQVWDMHEAKEGDQQFIVTNGRKLFAFNHGKGIMGVCQRHGLQDEHLTGTLAPSELVRSVLVVAGHVTCPPTYQPVQSGSVAVVNRNLEVHHHALLPNA